MHHQTRHEHTCPAASTDTVYEDLLTFPQGVVYLQDASFEHLVVPRNLMVDDLHLMERIRKCRPRGLQVSVRPVQVLEGERRHETNDALDAELAHGRDLGVRESRSDTR